jgi:malonyl-CoA O-methyltransferase
LIDKQRVARRFNMAASTYDQYAQVQQGMAQHLLNRVVERGQAPGRILEIGCGTGHLTQLLWTAFPTAEIVALDLAEKMVAVARRRVKAQGVSFVVADAEVWSAEAKGGYDLIISNATIQWFTQPQAMLAQWFRLLRPGGRLAASTFGPETFAELHCIYREVEHEWRLPSQYHGLPLPNPARWEAWLAETGWLDANVQEEKVKVAFPSCRHFLAAVKKTGASHSESRLPLLTECQLVKEVMARYDREYKAEGGVMATYHVVGMEGRKPD